VSSNAQLLDEGGGIRRSELDKLFNYMYSTAPRPPSPDAADTTPLVSTAWQSAVYCCKAVLLNFVRPVTHAPEFGAIN